MLKVIMFFFSFLPQTGQYEFSVQILGNLPIILVEEY